MSDVPEELRAKAEREARRFLDSIPDHIEGPIFEAAVEDLTKVTYRWLAMAQTRSKQGRTGTSADGLST